MMKKTIWPIIFCSGLLAQSLASARELPKLLKDFLKLNSQYHLLEASDIEDESMKGLFLQQLKKPKDAEFLPLHVGDFNRDGVADVAAILVKDSEFSAVVLHGGASMKSPSAHWLKKDNTEVLFGIGSPSTKYVVLVNCYGCEVSYVYGWTGFESLVSDKF